MEPVLIVMTNLPNLSVAESIATTLVEAKLAACVNVLPAVQSIYRWQGKVERASEVTLFIKTTDRHYAALESAIRAAHPYDVPEVIALPVTAGFPAYLQWVIAETDTGHHA
jgi:periplasmic divalent cation tolerance protein